MVGDADAVVRATRALINDLPIDYEHQTQNATPSGQPAPAAGWVKDLQVRGDGIYGRLGWTDRSRTMIDPREYRFLSPVFEYDPRTREITRIQMAGSTNDPALRPPDGGSPWAGPLPHGEIHRAEVFVKCDDRHGSRSQIDGIRGPW